MTTSLTVPTSAPSRADLTRAGRSQGLALSGQLLAGAGNLLVSAVLARMLLPEGYGDFVAFLAAYLLLHMVADSVTAALALDPALAQRLFRPALVIGLVVEGLLAALSPVLAPMMGLPVLAVLLLATAGPSATLLPLARGHLYGTQRIRGTAATLCVEPLIRGLFGVALVPMFGATGAALAVVAAGYAALLTATAFGRGGPNRVDADTASGGLPSFRSTAVTLTFLLVAVIATQDVIVANRILSGPQAGVIAAVATIGGAAYFATATIPMVLMPAGRQRRGHGPLLVAIYAAVAVSAVVIAVVALIPADWYARALGEGYRGVDTYVIGYVAAMASLGIAKVLLAQLCVTGRSRLAGSLVALALATQLALLLSAASVRDVVAASMTACFGLLLGSAVAVVSTLSAPRPARALVGGPRLPGRSVGAGVPGRAYPAAPAVPDTLGAPVAKPTWKERLLPLWPLGLALVIGVALRVIVTRSIWVDEAISIQQSQLPFWDMIATLRQNDVHPPLFGAVLWSMVHVTGSTAEWAVRIPSLIAGLVFIPLMYAMARDLWDRRTARIAALVAAVAPIAVWYAQEARMYAVWMLLATLAAWSQIRILRGTSDRPRSRNAWSLTPAALNWVVFCSTTVAMLYLHWFSALPLLVHHAVFAVLAVRSRDVRLARGWGISVVASLAAFAPLVPYLAAQVDSVLAATSISGAPAQTGAAASNATGADPDIYAVAANTIWAIWGYHADDTMVQLSALWPLALLACFGALGRSRTGYDFVLVLVAVVPAAMLFAFGFERRQFFELRYFTSTVPMLLLLLSRLAASWGRGPLTRLVVPVVVLASLAGGLVDQQVNQSNPRSYDFRGAVAWVKANSETGDVLLYAPGFLKSELDYYSAGIPAIRASSVKPRAKKTGMPKIPPDGRSVFVFGSFLNERVYAAEVGKTLFDLEAAGARETAVHKVANVTVWEFKEMPR